MKLWTVAAIAAVVLTGCSGTGTPDPAQTSLPAGITLQESVTSNPSGLVIPYQKYQLDNGLTVILAKDDSDPLVHVDMTYHVGSAREEAGRSGFAHLFEHMMFQGSKHVGDDEHFKIVTEAGGSMNGTTNSDRTNYFQTVPKNQLEKMLWLEADRMGFLLPAITSEKFEIQRETVKNERAQRIDNRPYGRMYERVSQALYPQGHPYSWPVIGWPADLDATEVADVRSFFARWYGPNNATLTIGGDFDDAQALAWVKKYFGNIPRGPEVTNMSKDLVTLDKDRYISMEDKVHLPLLMMTMPTVYARHQDEAALDLLAGIIGGGKTSLLYKNLVKSGAAVQAGSSHPCQELACTFSFYALANPAASPKLADMESAIRASIAEFESRGVSDDDLLKAKVNFRASTIFGLQSVSGKVSKLAYNQTFFDNPNLIQEELDRYDAVTKADVMRVFNQYIKDKPMVLMSVVPEGQTALIAAPDNFEAPAPLTAKGGHAKDVEQAQIVDNFDRSVMPSAGDNPSLTVPSLWQTQLASGIAVMGTQSTETPTTEVMVYFAGGHRMEALEQAGVASMTAAMMSEDSLKRSAEELTLELEKLGSSVSFSAGASNSTLRISTLTENLDATLAIVEERLKQPAFAQDDFARVKGQVLQGLQHNAKDPNWMARTASSKILFGDKSILGFPSSGTLETVNGLTVDQVKAFYAEQYQPAKAQVVVVSDLEQQQILPKLGFLADWRGGEEFVASPLALPELKGGTLYLIDKPGAAQSVVSITRVAMPFDATGDYFKARLMNYPLGGAFNSRINMNLREDKGYTYGARSYFSGNEEVGRFAAGASVRTEVTAASIQEMVNEINGYRDGGISEDELAFMRASISQGQALKYETPYQKAGFVRQIQKYQLSKDFIDQQSKIIETISKGEIDALAKRELDLSNMVVIVVGDKGVIGPSLEQLGFQIETMSL
ncbi:M16 family metallopeptidase [Paraferrimonas sedimenticola]|uniref:Peptidase M16 n=1 Tax=Paraferrimonas sedimenticola TaxID=375674 RepID=A0AA37RY31_9GAMM|nr:pitrilysin family protein [Paraferrimonas sedimenticola]GLP96817.1 peptidase M16 [Paraferrimonas sedimenticola]